MTVDTLIFSCSPDGPPQKLMGVHRMATEIRSAGLTCQIVHFFQFFSYPELTQLLKNLVGDNTLIVGFSTTFWETNIKDSRILKLKTIHAVNFIKQNFPNCKIVGGGHSSTLLTSYRLPRLDAVFDGFSEGIFLKYLNAVKQNTDYPASSYDIGMTKIYLQQTYSDNFNFVTSSIKYTSNDFIVAGEPTILEIARGCIFKCKFCAFPLNGKKKLDFIKEDSTLRDEIITNYEMFSIQHYILSDDTFNDSTEKIERIHKIFTNLPFKIKFSCYLRLDLLHAHPEQIVMLKEMGLVGAFFGVETFHHKAAQTIGKGLDPNKSKRLLHDLKTIHWKNDVKISVGLIAGLPYETYESYQATKDWILDESNLVDHVNVTALHIGNPAKGYYNNISLFEKNAADYGFYWTDSNSSWKTFNGPVKSFDEAKIIAVDLIAACQDAKRTYASAFGFIQAWKVVQHLSTVTFDELSKMDRIEYTCWKDEYFTKTNIEDYIENYKNNFKKL